jgi:hypothetical protein
MVSLLRLPTRYICLPACLPACLAACCLPADELSKKKNKKNKKNKKKRKSCQQ